MKKFILLFALISFTILSSCSGEDGAPGRDGKNGQDALISEVFELQNVNFGNTGNGYQIFQNLNPNIYASDVILMYLKTDVLTNGSPVWSSIPRTFTTNLGTVNYDFFSQSIRKSTRNNHNSKSLISDVCWRETQIICATRINCEILFAEIEIII